MAITHWYDRYSGIAPAFLNGLDFYYAGDFRSALGCFGKAARQTERGSCFNRLYQVYYGLVQLMLGDLSAIDLCRYAAHFEQYEADVHYVLALAELRLGNRQRAVNAIRSGLLIDSQHSRLKKLRRQIGQRRTPFFKSLSRDHCLNRVMGRILVRDRLR